MHCTDRAADRSHTSQAEATRDIAVYSSSLPLRSYALLLQGFGVIGGSAEGPQEVEGEPALSLTLGVLPGVSSLSVFLLIVFVLVSLLASIINLLALMTEQFASCDD